MKCGQVYNYPDSVTYDDYSIDILYDVIEPKMDYDKVYVKVHNKDYSLPIFDGSYSIPIPITRQVERFNGSIIKENDKYGYIDENANITIPAAYKNIWEFDKDKESLKTLTGETVDSNYSNYLLIKDENGSGIITKQGEFVIDCQYESIGCYAYNVFCVDKVIDGETKMGVIDINNNIIIDFVEGSFWNADFTENSYATFVVENTNHDKYLRSFNFGVVDKNLNVILEPIYSEVNIRDIEKEDGTSETIFIVEKGGKRAVIDTNKEIKIDYCEESDYELRNKYEETVRNNLK